MKVTIHPSLLKGMIQAPASKSSMQRACAAALLRKGETIIHHPGHSNDDQAALDIIQRLGAVVEVQGSEPGTNSYRVMSSGVKPKVDEINCRESGLSMRMFTPIAALSEKEIIINGSGSLVNRPMDFFEEVFPKLGVSIRSNGGKLPLIIKGPLRQKNIEIDGALSSQFLTGLLMAYSAADARDVSIRVRNLKSTPYVDLTLDVMKQFGMNLPENINYEDFYFPAIPKNQSINPPVNYSVEADWSSAAFLLVAGAIGGPVMVKGLDLTSTQADKVIVDVLMAAGAGIAIEAKGIKIHPSELKAFQFDATHCPDLFPPLVALAAYSKGKTRIKGVDRLVHKESNRAMALQEEFAKTGVKIEWQDNEMILQATGVVKAAKLHSHHDHRIAMACAVAALRADGVTELEEAGAVDKSYPDFFDDLKKLGADVSLSNKFRLHE